jgi:hypothetical protein
MHFVLQGRVTVSTMALEEENREFFWLLELVKQGNP